MPACELMWVGHTLEGSCAELGVGVACSRSRADSQADTIRCLILHMLFVACSHSLANVHMLLVACPHSQANAHTLGVLVACSSSCADSQADAIGCLFIHMLFVACSHSHAHFHMLGVASSCSCADSLVDMVGFLVPCACSA
eukprot:scaffold263337_cov17-Tisochrysis_lutea.AAC.2